MSSSIKKQIMRIVKANIRIVLFGVLFAVSFPFFLVKGVSIYFNNVTWNPHWVGMLSFSAIPILALTIFLSWCAYKVEEARRNQTQVPEGLDRAPLIVAWVGIILTILACVACVAIYLQANAIPAFNKLEWEIDVSPIQSFDAPSFVILYGVNDTAYANFSTNIPQKCSYPAYGYIPCTSNFTNVPTFHSEVYGDLTGYFFDGSDVVLLNLSSKVLLNTFVNYDSSAISAGYGNTRSPQNPYLYFAIFDSALNLTRFMEVLECGIVALSEMPALGSTTFSVTPYAVDDTLNALKLPDGTCRDIYNNGQTHIDYTSQATSTGDLTSVSCDTSSSSYDPNHDCISQVIIRYATTYMTTRSSKRHKENTDILIDIGGIVGGVCFVFWYFGIFAVR